MQSKGYKLVKTNFHFGKAGEIDLICEKGNLLVFVEVKLRTSRDYGAPEQSVTPTKQRHFRRAVEGYLYINKIHDKEIRIDFIGIDLSGGQHTIMHLENAF